MYTGNCCALLLFYVALRALLLLVSVVHQHVTALISSKVEFKICQDLPSVCAAFGKANKGMKQPREDMQYKFFAPMR